MDENLQAVIDLVNKSALDETIKKILVRDLQNEGLTDFLREQIKAYCLEGIKQLDALEEANKLLNVKKPQNPVE